MKRILFCIVLAVTLAACQKTQTLEERAAELCAYIPDHELLEKSRDYMTPDFYAVLDTMFYRLPQHEALDHEWIYYFVTGNGGTIADYEVVKVEQSDKDHAVATILVRQKWAEYPPDETGGTASAEEGEIPEEHILSMERVNGQWLMADFDGHKADCIRYIANNRKEQAIRQAISDYLLREIAPQYLQGELCVPTLMIVAEDEDEPESVSVFGDFWVFWYNIAGDTLKAVSGGDHPGLITISYENNQPQVVAFERVEDGSRFTPSAKRIFSGRYDIFINMHSNEWVREAVRREQLSEYVLQNDLNVHYYQDFGWEPKELEL